MTQYDLVVELLVFAHKNEAQCFIDQLHAEKVNCNIDTVFSFGNGLILISGEGIEATLAKTSAILAQFTQVGTVFNIGVCGKLPYSQKIDADTISVRTIYGEQSDYKPYFKSFTTADKHSSLDLISAQSRVLNNNYANALSPFAPLVDREAWAVGYSCQLFHKKLFCIKTISDAAGESTKCFDVRAESLLYSQKLYNFYCDFYDKKMQKTTPQAKKSINTPEGFYFTTSQRQTLQKTLNSLSKKHDCSIEEFYSKKHTSQFLEMDIHPKKRTQLFISYLMDLLSPFQAKVRGKLHKLVEPISNEKFYVSTNNLLETEDIKINMNIRNERDLTDCIDNLKKLPLKQIQSTLRGEH